MSLAHSIGERLCKDVMQCLPKARAQSVGTESWRQRGVQDEITGEIVLAGKGRALILRVRGYKIRQHSSYIGYDEDVIKPPWSTTWH